MRAVAFLRGMNLGRRRITNDELRAHFERAGFAGATPYQASGNVVLDLDREPSAVEPEIESRLADALGYPVDTHVRTLAELADLVASEATKAPGDGFKVHVIFTRRPVDGEEAAALSALEGPDDRFRPLGRAVLWFRRGGLKDSGIRPADLEAALGPEQTMRTLGTVRRIVSKFGE
ncbi:MAG: DUF1697 domain-containing protein [Longimicrobiales bacterium]|nr:DUF1697 domain-containing protein [Longimicrobiales bacterium]